MKILVAFLIFQFFFSQEKIKNNFQSEIITQGNTSFVNDSIQPIISRNLLYYFVPNQINIWVPYANSIEILNSDVKKINNYGQYEILIKDTLSNIYLLKIKATFLNNSKTFEIPIKVKFSKHPTININDQNGYLILKYEELENSIISIQTRDPYFDNNLKINGFIIQCEPNQYKVIEGDKITEETVDWILNQNINEITISNVKVNVGHHISNHEILKIKLLK